MYNDDALPALFVSGGTYFFTVSLRRRNLRQLVESIDLLRLAFRKTLEAKPFQIDAMVAIESNCLSWLFSVRKNTLSHINRTLKTKHSYSQVKDAIQQPCKPFKG